MYFTKLKAIIGVLICFISIYENSMLDSLHRRILRFLQSDPTALLSELAERCQSQPATVARRLGRLKGEGVMRGLHAVIDWAALGYGVEVSLRFTLDKTNSKAFDEFLAAARQIKQVIAIQTFSGRVDVRLSVIAKDMPDYQKLYRSEILNLPHIAELEALMHVATLKTVEALPL